MAAIIIVTIPNSEERHYHGPFPGGHEATFWGHQNLQGHDWHWEEMSRPGTTYMTCSASDITDFVEGVLTTDDECYVTVNDVNWCVLKEV